MRIDKAHGIEPPNPAENRPGGAAPANLAKKPGTEAAVDGSQIRADSQPYVRQVMALPEVDQQAVEQARALIQAGQLDTADALERLANKLLDLGA